MPSLPTHEFGRTGHASTRVLFGAAALSRSTPEEAEEALALLIAHGVNHIDTAASYGDSELLVGAWMPAHRDRFFLATKTGERTYEGAKAQLAQSLERLQTDHVDLIQLHNLVGRSEWETALGPDGALRAAIEARDAGLTRFIGVTGHGLEAPGRHRESLERFDFDSVLCPFNYPMMMNPQYASDFEALAKTCRERKVAHQTIKAITLGPWDEKEKTHGTWYEPLQHPADIALAVRWVLGQPGVFLNSAGDMSLLPHVLVAAKAGGPRPTDEQMETLTAQRGMAPLFA